MTQRPRHSSTFFPYTTLFRSQADGFDAGPLFRLAKRQSQDNGHQPGSNGAESPPPPLPVDPPTIRSSKNQRSEEHTSELQSRQYVVCHLLLEKKNQVAI